MKDRFDLIIFDWDGTLVDSVDWIVQCLSVAAGKQGREIPSKQAIKNIIGLSIHKALDELFPGIDQNTREQLITCYSQEFFSKQISEQDLFVGVDDMLHKLKQQGYQLAVATGKSRAGLDKAMQGTGLQAFFHITRCADETASKPQTLMLEEIISELAVSRDRVLFVGDSTHDMKMANNANVSAIAVTCGANSLDQLNEFKPLLNLQQTTELLDILHKG